MNKIDNMLNIIYSNTERDMQEKNYNYFLENISRWFTKVLFVRRDKTNKLLVYMKNSDIYLIILTEIKIKIYVLVNMKYSIKFF